MGEMITKPDANPILLLILNLIVCGIPVGHFMVGQTKKGVILLVATWVLYVVGLGWIITLVGAYDIYLLGQKLATGAAIGQNENGFKPLDAVFKD